MNLWTGSQGSSSPERAGRSPNNRKVRPMTSEEAKKLLEACRVLDRLGVSDFIYDIKDRHGNEVPDDVSSWKAPSVKAWGAACTLISELVKKYPALDHEAIKR